MAKIPRCRIRLVAVLAGNLLPLALAATARGQDTYEFITDGISPGTMYAFQATLTGRGLDDVTKSYFVNESTSAHFPDDAFTTTYPELQVVQDDFYDVTEQRQTFHVGATSAASVAPVLDGASFNARQVWAFLVTDPEGFAGPEPLHAVISGRVFLNGYLFVFGAGSARVEVRIRVRERLPSTQEYAVGGVVVTQVIGSYAIDHPMEFEVGASLGVILGLPFAGGGGGVSAGRPSSNETIRLTNEELEFSCPLEVVVGKAYELEFSFSGTATNRGLPLNSSWIRFAHEADGAASAADSPPPQAEDPSHLLGAVEFFKLELPELSLGDPFTGTEKWNFPKLNGLFDGKLINMSNDFRMEPLGKIASIKAAVEKLGFATKLGENIAHSGEAGSAGAPPADGIAIPPSSGVWIGDLVITIASQ